MSCERRTDETEDDDAAARLMDDDQAAARREEDGLAAPTDEAGRHWPTMRACISPNGDDDGTSANGARSAAVRAQGRTRCKRD